MKIAILTLSLHSNYGGVIQNYALQEILKKRGHEVYTIKIQRPEKALSLKDKLVKYPVRFCRKIMGRKDGIIFVEKKKKRDDEISLSRITEFINRHINFTPNTYHNVEDLRKLNESNLNAIIVGSDQVWRPSYLYPSLETFFLNFIDNNIIKKIAYAASFGTDKAEFNQQQIATCGQLIKKFDAISVRELSAIDVINHLYNWNPQVPILQVLDPTMLLNKSDYEKLISNQDEKIPTGDLFCYILDDNEEKRNIINQLSKELQFTPYRVERKSNDFWDAAENKIYPSIEQWLKGFQQAKYVFTDSFHGCVFSIIFNKPFLAIGNAQRGMSRFNSLFKSFDLNNRLIYKALDLDKEKIHYKFNWEEINKRKERLQSISLSFLEKNIN